MSPAKTGGQASPRSRKHVFLCVKCCTILFSIQLIVMSVKKRTAKLSDYLACPNKTIGCTLIIELPIAVTFKKHFIFSGFGHD